MLRSGYDGSQYFQGALGAGATANGPGNLLDTAGVAVWVDLQELAGGTATVTFEGTYDGAQFYPIGYYQVDGVGTLTRSGSAVSVVANAKHVYELDDAYPAIRARISGVAGGGSITARAYMVEQV